MQIDFLEWLNLAVRWLHLTAGIAWIGASFYFVWLDNSLEKAPADAEAAGVSGHLWSVHGGGFYHNEKYPVGPEQMPKHLHWFKWEAYVTWLSGFSMLVLVYYIGARSFLIDPSKANLAVDDATALGISSLIVSWLFYHLVCKSPLGRDPRVMGAIWFAYLVGAAAFLESVFNSRGAYLHIGAIIGTAMVGNVFFVIIPNQKKVVAALRAGEPIDPKLGAEGKQRSVHNNYMTLPVLFIMISHHYPMTYGADRPWLVLALLGATGIAVRHVFNVRHHDGKTGKWIALAVVLALASVTYVSMEKAGAKPAAPVAQANTLNYASIKPIMQKHCTECHAAAPTSDLFSEPPLGLKLETYAEVHAARDKVKAMAVDSDVMPLGNMTGMTEEERATLGAWIAKGAPE
ncbi:urate hydroxylase PuuD [Croceicoccus mobilis]|uniref:Membrane protein n=1 Tax=Croceicoccus mobilis TaxID=1703339 RepID=A0A917DU79_9SPHN|nr:urate hydroxylase PuuD [Croceicoccus mobilis]GGD70850.1 membrane protein [Croceicoccus mobilis]